MIGSVKVYYEGIKVFLEIDQMEDFKLIILLVLVMQGDDDQVVFYKNVFILQDKLLLNSQLKIYSGFLYGMYIFYVDIINVDLLVFICV